MCVIVYFVPCGVIVRWWVCLFAYVVLFGCLLCCLFVCLCALVGLVGRCVVCVFGGLFVWLVMCSLDCCFGSCVARLFVCVCLVWVWLRLWFVV